MNKILCVGPAWVGDMVMAQCLFKLLKNRCPDGVLHVLAPAWSFPLLERMPEIDHAIVLPFAHGELNLRGRYELGKKLRAEKYDQAIVLPNSFKSALIPWIANIPKRTGWLGEMRWGLLNDVRYLDEKKYPLMIERFMALGLDKNEALPSPYPLPELKTKNSSREKSRVIALCPGAEFGPAKRWPEEYYAEVANAKLDAGWKVYILGSLKDQPVAEKIMNLTNGRSENFAGRTSLGEAIELLSLADIVVSNDSGLMHIAAALNKPLVAIYGPTSPTFTPPLNDKAKIQKLSLECQPCFKRECPLKHHRCMKELSPQKILETIEELCAF